MNAEMQHPRKLHCMSCGKQGHLTSACGLPAESQERMMQEFISRLGTADDPETWRGIGESYAAAPPPCQMCNNEADGCAFCDHPPAPPRYMAEPNDSSNNAVYPWRVRDVLLDRIIAFSVTGHTANAWAKQLNEVGYVETI